MKTVIGYNENGDRIGYLITDLQANERAKGFRITFRTYNLSQGIGGFETTFCVSNADINLHPMFCGFLYEAQNVAKMFSATITSKKTNNKPAARFSFDAVAKHFQL